MGGAELSDLKAMFADASVIGAIAAFGTLTALYAKEPRLPTEAELYGAGIAFGTAFFGALGIARRVVANIRTRRKVV